MDKQLHELSFSIQQKEEQMKELTQNESEANQLTAQYESRIVELEAEVHRHHLLLVCLFFFSILKMDLSTSLWPLELLEPSIMNPSD